jgi:TubC N-terminal docking domain
MSRANEILTELQRRGVIVAVDGNTLSLKPKSALDDRLLARVREVKPAILEALRNRPATCSLDCYELEPGVWIHRPHTGCTTIKPKANGSQHKVAATCWHCRGQKKCGCSACWQGGPRECVACKGTGQGWRWLQ